MGWICTLSCVLQLRQQLDAAQASSAASLHAASERYDRDVEALRSQLRSAAAEASASVARITAEADERRVMQEAMVSDLRARHALELEQRVGAAQRQAEEEKRAMQRQWAADEEARREAASLAAVAREREDAERNRQLSIERLEWMKERQKGEEGMYGQCVVGIVERYLSSLSLR